MFVISFYDIFLQAENFYMLLNNEGESMFCCHIYSVQILNLSNECFKNSRLEVEYKQKLYIYSIKIEMIRPKYLKA